MQTRQKKTAEGEAPHERHETKVTHAIAYPHRPGVDPEPVPDRKTRREVNLTRANSRRHEMQDYWEE